MASKHQGTVDELYDKYARTLEMLNKALDENQTLKAQLDEKPTLDKVDLQKTKIKELEKKNTELTSELEKLRQKKYDYWGKPKNSKKQIDDTSYEQATYQRYQRLLKEVQLGRLDINSLQQAEQNIIRQLMNE